MNNKGLVYALINPGMPGYVKIGKTKRDIEKRINELSSSSGVPHKYACAYSIEVSDCHIVEKKLHEDFSKYRVNNNREFFEIDLKTIMDKMVEYQNNFNSEEEFSNFEMALNYHFGDDNYEKDLFKARKYFEAALEDGDYEACLYLAQMESSGEAGFNKSFNAAIKTLNIAVQNGLDEAYADLGSIYFFNDDYKNSMISWNNYILSKNIDEEDKSFQYFYYIRCCYHMEVEVEHSYKLQNLKNEIMKTYLRISMDDDFEMDKQFYDFLNYNLGNFTTGEVNYLRGEVYSEKHNSDSEDENYDDDFEEEIEEEVTTFDIGENYYYGLEDSIKDERIALGYFRQAIKERDYRAYFHIGNMYNYQEGGLKESKNKAIENFILGTEAGINDCHAELAKLYTHEQNYENAYKSWINYMSKDNYSFEWSILENYLDYIYYCYREKKKLDFIEKINPKKQKIYIALLKRIKNGSISKTDFDLFEFLKENIGKTDIKELIENYYPNVKNRTRYNRYGYDEDGYDEFNFDKNGIHKLTDTKYNLKGYNKHGYDEDGYNEFNFNKNGIHKITNIKSNRKSYSEEGYSKDKSINLDKKQEKIVFKNNSFVSLLKKIFIKK
ncbi:MAG: GIY-YIG nuclease family protein [Fusobacteriaceae bacterium]